MGADGRLGGGARYTDVPRWKPAGLERGPEQASATRVTEGNWLARRNQKARSACAAPFDCPSSHRCSRRDARCFTWLIRRLVSLHGTFNDTRCNVGRFPHSGRSGRKPGKSFSEKHDSRISKLEKRCWDARPTRAVLQQYYKQKTKKVLRSRRGRHKHLKHFVIAAHAGGHGSVQ